MKINMIHIWAIPLSRIRDVWRLLVWINKPLMPSSDVATRKTGNDFDWLILIGSHNYLYDYEKLLIFRG